MRRARQVTSLVLLVLGAFIGIGAPVSVFAALLYSSLIPLLTFFVVMSAVYSVVYFYMPRLITTRPRS
jgi:hypothetical protein